ncbi:fumarylacetoacetase [Olea europaea subsp. europaea]|uniref:Fumarylacetoacetase n=1 Tax=Olea europaea subsp. europaea TaxID=158383 RepID=A0A8S0PQR0_OLEEU|nr:fumarylacetoacetase [Olea europaea subsp. europaea]
MALTSFIEVQSDSHVAIQNLPYSVSKLEHDSEPRLGVAIGEYALDLSVIASVGLFDGPRNGIGVNYDGVRFRGPRLMAQRKRKSGSRNEEVETRDRGERLCCEGDGLLRRAFGRKGFLIGD